MSSLLGTQLKAAQYRILIKELTTLFRYKDLVSEHLDGKDGKDPELAKQVLQLFNRYSRDTFSISVSQSEDPSDSTETSTPSPTDPFTLYQQAHPPLSIPLVDSLGRSYALGRRKESSTRVWLIPSKPDPDTIGQVLLNSKPMSSYFTRTSHREAVLHPLRLAGLLGAFNVFALVKGGGHSGQAGAVAHGISKALVRWFEHQFRIEGDEIKKEGLESRWKEVRTLLLKGEFGGFVIDFSRREAELRKRWKERDQ